MEQNFNFLRKLFHFSGVIISFFYYINFIDIFNIHIFYDNNRSFISLTLLLLILFLTVVEFFRFRNEKIQNLFIKFTGKMLKKDELYRVNGSLPFLAGLFIITAFLPKNIAILSAVFLVSADPAAAYFGSRYGKTRFYNGKSIEGTIAAFFSAFFLGIAFLIINYFYASDSILNVNTKSIIIVSIGAASSAIVEFFSSRDWLDDNLLLPVFSGIIMTIAYSLIFNIEMHLILLSPEKIFLPL